MSLGGILH